jgi:beta-lactamase regulating signal transducer with metallopeptidase domain
MRELHAIRHDAEVQRDQALLMRYRARRQRRYARSTYQRLLAPQILAMLSEGDLSDLEDVTPTLRMIPGGRA